MAAKKRCELAGTFRAVPLEGRAWRLSRGGADPAEIFLRGIDGGLEDGDTLRDLDIEWGAESAVLTATFDDGRRGINVASAIVHQPLANLYDVLPLADFGPRARRFWGRVFRVVRLPGGRHLLRILARRTRNRP